MNKQREALKMALEALNAVQDFGYNSRRQQIIYFISEVLAEPEQKPLTDYQICEIDELVWKELSWEEKTFCNFALKIARAIERAHGIE